MPVIDLTNPLTVALCLAAIVATIFLGHEIKRSVVPAIALVLSMGLLILHTVQLFAFGEYYANYTVILSTSMLYDFGFVLVTYLAYLWIDDIEAKHRNKKSIDNSLDWFWSKI